MSTQDSLQVIGAYFENHDEQYLAENVEFCDMTAAQPFRGLEAMVQPGVQPRGVGVILILSGLINMGAVPAWPISIIGFIGQLLFAGAIAWGGYTLVSRQAEKALQPSFPVTELRSTEVGR